MHSVMLDMLYSDMCVHVVIVELVWQITFETELNLNVEWRKNMF